MMYEHKKVKIDPELLDGLTVDAKEQFKEWDIMVDNNIDEWLDDFCTMMRKRENWNVNFEEFIEVAMFKLEFKDMIAETFVDYKEDNPEEDISYDAFAYNLLQQSKREAETFMNAQGGEA